MANPASYQNQPAPRVVSKGTSSNRKSIGSWQLKPQVPVGLKKVKAPF